MKSNFIKSILNASIASLCQVFTLILSFVARSIFIKYLSAEYLGINGLFSNVLTVLSFTELGIGNVMVYTLYEPIKKNDYIKIKSLLDLYKTAYRYIALTIFILGCIITPNISMFIKSTPNISEDIRVLFFLYLLNTVFSYFFIYKKSLLLANQKSYILNIVTSISQIFLVICQIVILVISKSFIAYLICQIIFTIMTNLILSVIVSKNNKEIFKAESSKLPSEDKKDIVENIKSLAISKVSGIVSSGTDNIIISKLFGLISVGYISNYIMIINSVNNIVYNGFISISAVIGSFNVDSSLDSKRKIFDELFLSVYFVYSFVCVCLLIITPIFIGLWIGEEYILKFSILFNIIMGIYVSGMNYPVYAFRTTMGYYKQVKYVYVACAISNILLSIVFGKIFGISGVFAATWISKIIFPEIADSYFSYKIILNRKHDEYFLKYTLFFIIMIVNAYFCYKVVNLVIIGGWIGLIVKTSICGVLNIIVNLLLFCRNVEFKNLVERFKTIYYGRKRFN